MFQMDVPFLFIWWKITFVTGVSVLQINYILSFEEITLKFIGVNEQVIVESLIDDMVLINNLDV